MVEWYTSPFSGAGVCAEPGDDDVLRTAPGIVDVLDDLEVLRPVTEHVRAGDARLAPPRHSRDWLEAVATVVVVGEPAARVAKHAGDRLGVPREGASDPVEDGLLDEVPRAGR